MSWSFQLPAWAGTGAHSRCSPPSPPTLGLGLPRPSSQSGPTSPAPSCLPDPRRRREDGEPRPPRTAPPLSTESSEEEGSEPDSEGFCRLRLGGRRDGGGSSSSSDSEPWVNQQVHVSADNPWLPKSLKSGNWEAKERMQDKRNPQVSLQGR